MISLTLRWSPIAAVGFWCLRASFGSRWRTRVNSSLKKYKMQTDSILSSNSETHLLSETIIAHVGDQGIAASTPDRVIEPLPGTLLPFLGHFTYDKFPSSNFFFFGLCSQKAYSTMGCLDTWRGGKFLHCITASWKGM